MFNIIKVVITNIAETFLWFEFPYHIATQCTLTILLRVSIYIFCFGEFSIDDSHKSSWLPETLTLTIPTSHAVYLSIYLYIYIYIYICIITTWGDSRSEQDQGCKEGGQTAPSWYSPAMLECKHLHEDVHYLGRALHRMSAFPTFCSEWP
jgi:hypothetical protein